MTENRTFVGTVLESRYAISKKIDEGSCGKIYEIDDIKNPQNKGLVLKLAEDADQLLEEVENLKKVDNTLRLLL